MPAYAGACAACVAGKYKPAAGNSACTECGDASIRLTTYGLDASIRD